MEQSVILSPVKSANSNSVYTYTPDNTGSPLKINEYCVFVGGNSDDYDISDIDLEFNVTVNDSVNRFSWDGSKNRWCCDRGYSAPLIGVVSNELKTSFIPVDSDSPYMVFIGDREKYLSYSVVDNDGMFTSQQRGNIQISRESGLINFNNEDLEQYSGKNVYVNTQQFDNKSSGLVSTIVDNNGFSFYINPIPGPNQTPLIKIHNKEYLNVINTGSPQSGDVLINEYGLCTLSNSDSELFSGFDVYYDGVINFKRSLTKQDLCVISDNKKHPNQAGLINQYNNNHSYYISVNNGNSVYYLDVVISSVVPSEVKPNTAVIHNGTVYVSNDDTNVKNGSVLQCVDSFLYIDDGCYLQLYRSAINSYGVPTVSDFFRNHKLTNEPVATELTQSPFVPLASLPVDNGNIKLTVKNGKKGGFTGDLNKLIDDVNGYSYYVDMQFKQLKLFNRKKITVNNDKSFQSITLPDQAITNINVDLVNNGVVIDGDSYIMNRNSGTIEFVKKHENEVLVENVFEDIKIERKNFLVYVNGTKIGVDEYTLTKSISQVNFNKSLNNGDKVTVEYVSNGTSYSEDGLFKIRQEVCSVLNDNTAAYNTNNKTVDGDISLFVDGIKTKYTKKTNNTISVGTSLTNKHVSVDYSVKECSGGEKFIKLKNSPITVDDPIISQTTKFNGDVSGKLSAGSFLFVDNNVYSVLSSYYDGSVTTVSLSGGPDGQIDQYTSISVCSRITFNEMTGVFQFNNGSNYFTVSGDVSSYVQSNSVINVNGDLYWVVGSVYESGTTTITIKTKFKKTYITSVFKFSKKIFSSSSSFSTLNSLHILKPFSMTKNGATYNCVVTDGGGITLNEPVVNGDIITISYYGRDTKPPGYSVDISYSHNIAPSASNGLIGQSIIGNYLIYSPDTFYFNTKSVSDSVSDYARYLSSSSQYSTTGPTKSYSTNSDNSTFGVKSFWFDEKSLSNFDVVNSYLLKSYNDVANCIDNFKFNISGVVVGGSSGRFRFDGNRNNQTRESYFDVTNDVHDSIRVGSYEKLTGFITTETVGVYSRMWETNSMSRLFSSSHIDKPVVIRKLDNPTTILGVGTRFTELFKTIGGFNVNNVSSWSTLKTRQSRSRFIRISDYKIKIIDGNGNTNSFVPKFEQDALFVAYNQNGQPVFDQTTEQKVVSVSGDELTIDKVMPVEYGSIALNNYLTKNESGSKSRAYDGSFVSVSSDNGEIKYMRLPKTTQDDDFLGEEILSSNIVFSNGNTSPSKISALFGGELNDYGEIDVIRPVAVGEFGPLSYGSCDIILSRIQNSYVQATVLNNTILCVVPNDVENGDEIEFLSGPNSGTVLTILSHTQSQITVSLAVDDATQRTLYFKKNNIQWHIDNIINVLDSNSYAPVSSVNLLGSCDSTTKSELALLNSAYSMTYTGNVMASNNNTILLSNTSVGNVLYTTHISDSSYGLYNVINVSGSTVTLDRPIPQIGQVACNVYSTEKSLYSESLLDIIKYSTVSNKKLYDSIQTYKQSQPTHNSIQLLVNAINARKQDVSQLLTIIDSVLSTESIYDKRFMWIDQMVNKKTGILVKLQISVNDRIDRQSKARSELLKISTLSSVERALK